MTENSLSAAADGPAPGGPDRSPAAPAGGPAAAGRHHQLRAVHDTQDGEGLPVPEPADPGLAAQLAELTSQAAEAMQACSLFTIEQRWRALVPAGEDPKAHKEAIEAAHAALVDDMHEAEARAVRFLNEHPGAVPMLRDALRWHRAGWAPLPIRLDGSKAPLVDEWRQYHGAGNRMAEEQVREHFQNDHPGLATMLGLVSGNRVMLEFEARGIAEGYRDGWMQLLRDRGHGELLERYLGGLVIQSPSGGLNGFVQVDSAEPAGSERLISRERTQEEAEEWREQHDKDDSVAVPHIVLAEVKGDRGYTLVWPSPSIGYPGIARSCGPPTRGHAPGKLWSCDRLPRAVISRPAIPGLRAGGAGAHKRARGRGPLGVRGVR